MKKKRKEKNVSRVNSICILSYGIWFCMKLTMGCEKPDSKINALELAPTKQNAGSKNWHLHWIPIQIRV